MIDYEGYPGLHDAGRYNEGIYWANMETLKYYYPNKFDQAFKYYILHHVLDVIEQKLVSYFAHPGYLSISSYSERPATYIVRSITNFVLDTIKNFEIPWDNKNVKQVKDEISEYFKHNPNSLKKLIVDIISSRKFKRRVYIACKNKYPYLRDLSKSIGQLCVQNVEKTILALRSKGRIK